MGFPAPLRGLFPETFFLGSGCFYAYDLGHGGVQEFFPSIPSRAADIFLSLFLSFFVFTVL